MALAAWGIGPAAAEQTSPPPTSAEQISPTPTPADPGIAAETAETPAPPVTPEATPTGLAPEPAPLPVISVVGPIAAKWQALGGADGSLGNAIAERNCSRGPCHQEFDGGTIFSLGSGTVVVVYRTLGNTGPHWFSSGGLASSYGYPESDESFAGGGSFQQFKPFNGWGSHGLTWRAQYGILPVEANSEVGYSWMTRGGISGLGYPTAKMNCGLRNDGCSQNYDRGTLVSSTGTGATVILGAVRAKWTSLSAQNGILGYPEWDEDCSGGVGTCAQRFQGGSIVWSAKTGAVVVRGSIGSRYWDSYGIQGKLGLPLKDETCNLRAKGCLQNFQNGQIFWSPTTGSHMVYGAIGGKYRALGAQNGTLGYPTSSEVCGMSGGGCRQSFQGGDILWSPGSGAYSLRGGIRAAHNRFFPAGYPLGEEVCGLAQNGCYQQFQTGRMYWSPKVGAAQFVKNGIQAQWNKLGGPGGRVGYPIWNEVCANGYCEQRFQFGVVTWTARGGIPW